MASEQSAPATDAPAVEPTPTIETPVEVKTEGPAIAASTATSGATENATEGVSENATMNTTESATEDATANETVNETAGAEEDTNATPSQAAPATPLPTGLKKQQLDILDGIVRRLSDYKDPEEYV